MRRLLTFIAGLTLIMAAQGVHAQGAVHLLVQSSPLAGFRYYAAESRWELMKEGQTLVLIQGEKLGYLPRRENRAVAAAMDAGDKIEARIAKLREHRDPWLRVLIDVFVAL